MDISEIRQGYTYVYSKVIYDSAISLCPEETDFSCCFVLTQDCDIVRDKEKEPYIEFLLGKEIQTLDANSMKGKNPRTLHLEESDLKMAFSVYDRIFVKKRTLEELDLEKTSFSIQRENKACVLRWMGQRYIRPAFPDAFNSRLNRCKKLKKLGYDEESKHVSHIFFQVCDEELPDTDFYDLKILVVVDEKSHSEKVEDNYLKFFNENELKENHINVDLRVVTEDEVSLDTLRKYKRWVKDYLSFSEGSMTSPDVDIA